MKGICHISCGKFAEECHLVKMNKEHECRKHRFCLKQKREEINDKIIELSDDIIFSTIEQKQAIKKLSKEGKK